MDDVPGAACADATHSAERVGNYTEKIEDTLVSFEMTAVPAGEFEFAVGEERPAAGGGEAVLDGPDS